MHSALSGGTCCGSTEVAMSTEIVDTLETPVDVNTILLDVQQLTYRTPGIGGLKSCSTTPTIQQKATAIGNEKSKETPAPSCGVPGICFICFETDLARIIPRSEIAKKGIRTPSLSITRLCESGRMWE